MREQRKKIKVKTKKVDQTIERYTNFLWTLYDQEEKGNKTILYFKRGEVELVDKKAKKKVKDFEKAYVQISKKKFPLAFVILSLLALAAFIPTFVLDLEQLFNLILYVVGSIFACMALFAFLLFILILFKRKSLKEKCVESAQYYNGKLEGELDPGQHVNTIESYDQNDIDTSQDEENNNE